MKLVWLLCVAVWLAFVADEVCAVNPKVKRESSQEVVSFRGKAVNPGIDSSVRSTESRLKSLDKQSLFDAAKKKGPLKMPKYGLVLASDIRNYPLVDRYLEDSLANPQVNAYFILQEDYAFEDLEGQHHVIPAGFIWDGASIPNLKEKTLKGWVSTGWLEVGNTRYTSAISEGLIHDWMYRNPLKYSKVDADLLFYANLIRCNNPDPGAMYLGVHYAGDDSYNAHRDKALKGLYDDFDSDFYKTNTVIYKSGQTAHNPEAAVRDQQDKKDGQIEEKVSHAKPVSMDDLKKMDLDDSNGDWCQCANPGCAKEINRENGKFKSFYIGFRCAHCKKVNVKFAKEALCYEKLIKDAGGDSQWLGQNAEADAKAAGNVK